MVIALGEDYSFVLQPIQLIFLHMNANLDLKVLLSIPREILPYEEEFYLLVLRILNFRNQYFYFRFEVNFNKRYSFIIYVIAYRVIVTVVFLSNIHYFALSWTSLILSQSAQFYFLIIHFN